MKKRILSALLCVTMMASLVVGCGAPAAADTTPAATEDAASAEATGEEKISEKDVKELLSDLTESLTDELEDLKEEKSAAIQIAVYSKSNNPVRIEFNMIDDVENYLQ